MKLRLLGQRNNLGIGVLFAGIADALKRLYWIEKNVEEIDVAQSGSLQHAALSSQPTDVNVWLSPDLAAQHFKGAQVLWAIFESDYLPPIYLSYLHDHVDLIWAPSNWARLVLIKNGVDEGKIDVVPFGIDCNLFHPYLRSPSTAHDVPFRFLMLGKFEERKAYRQLLAAFEKTYGNSDDVVLMIKADYFLNHQKKMDDLNDLVASLGLNNVKTFWGRWSNESIMALYNYAHAFVFPSRAEGWGFPLLEAIATGLPAIATHYSGHTEFLEPIADAVLKIDHTMEAIEDEEFMGCWPSETNEFGNWANPSADSIARNLVEMREHYDKYASLSLEISETVRQRFTWANSASHALRSMRSRDLLRIDAKVSEI